MTKYNARRGQQFAGFGALRRRHVSVPLLAPIWAAAFLFALASPWLGPPSALAQETCPGDPPVPTAVAVTEAPIVVASTTADYFVLYVTHDLDGAEVDIPVLVKRGEAGTTTLSETIAPLPAERYRVEKYFITEPADVDGDCIDDLTELDNLGSMNPVNPAAAIEITDGAVAIPDHAAFETLAHRSTDELIVKFVLFGANTDRPRLYFINTKTYTRHDDFFDAVGLEQGGLPSMTAGEVTYDRELAAADGSAAAYRYWLRFSDGFDFVSRSYTALAASLPLVDHDLAYHVQNPGLLNFQYDLQLFQASRITRVFDEDVHTDSDFVSMNPGEAYGLLRIIGPEQRPNPRDVVLYDVLPNELPRVVGIITTVPQTPLSHVNLRAVQDGVPNAFIRGALDDNEIGPLVGSFVHYTVAEGGYTIRAATREEVDAHYAWSRPTGAQTPQRDLSVTSIKPLREVGFDDWDAFGVKAANVAVLGTLGFQEGTVPDGFAIPFYFYDEFMKHNGFYTRIETMLADPDFQTDFDTQETELKDLRKAIEDADTPQWIIDAIVEMNESFDDGVNRRYRSSTNNEDLPGFNGAGLYDSKSQKPSEDEKDLAKSLKEVYASLWNFRAFVERDFHRVDHLAAAMGILVHPSYQDELANGVAVSFDPINDEDASYYVNTQVGEDLVTNPDAHSVPEEVLVGKSASYVIVLGTSNQVAPGELILSRSQLFELRRRLKTIHRHFERLYDPEAGERFAMEIEFKITSDNILAIKQARPWVFNTPSAESDFEPPITVPPVVITPPPAITSGGGGFAVGGGGGGGGPTPSLVDFEWTVKRDIEALDSGHDEPTGSWSDGTTLWIVDNGSGADDEVYAYSLITGERVEGREFTLDGTNRAPRGFWSDSEAVWVSDSGRDHVFVYDLESGERLDEREVELDDANDDARGIWSDGETLWVLDDRAQALFAYDLESGELQGQYELDADNSDPHDLWSDGVTVWVSDHGAKRLFAYRLPALAPPVARSEGATAASAGVDARAQNQDIPP